MRSLTVALDGSLVVAANNAGVLGQPGHVAAHNHFLLEPPRIIAVIAWLVYAHKIDDRQQISL